MLIKATALSIADSGVTLNAIATNYLNYPNFRAAIESQVPMGRLGDPSEVAHFAVGLLDGESRFQTGQFFSLSGGWGD